MLLDGELDAAIFGGAMPSEPRLKSVIPDPDAAAKEWYKKNGAVPVNHMVVLKAEPVEVASRRWCARFIRMLLAEQEGRGSAEARRGRSRSRSVSTRCKPSLELMSSYAFEMKLDPRRYSVEELFDDTTRTLQA